MASKTGRKPKGWPGWPGRAVGHGVCVAVSELPDAGRGLFVTETEVDAGDIITGYDGTKLSAAEARRFAPHQCTHIASVNPHVCVYGVSCPALAQREQLAGASFINGLPNGDERINAELVTIIFPECHENKFAVAKRKIKVGEEVYVSYYTNLSRHMAMGGSRTDRIVVPQVARVKKRPIRIQEGQSNEGKPPKRSKLKSASSSCGETTRDAAKKPVVSHNTLFRSSELPTGQTSQLAEHSSGIVVLHQCKPQRQGHWRLEKICEAGKCGHGRVYFEQNCSGDVVCFGSRVPHVPVVCGFVQTHAQMAQPQSKSTRAEKLAVVGLQLFCQDGLRLGGSSNQPCDGIRAKNDGTWYAAAKLDEETCTLCLQLTKLLLTNWHGKDLKPFRKDMICMGTDLRDTTLIFSNDSAVKLAKRLPPFQALVDVISRVRQVYELQTGKHAEIEEVWLNIKEEGGSGSTFCAHVDILSPSVSHSGTATLPLGFALFRGEKLLPDCVSSSVTTLHELDADRALSRCSTDAAGTRARTHPWHVASLALNWAHVDGPHFVSGLELHDADATADHALSRCSTDAAGTRALDDADAADQEVWNYMEALDCQSTGPSDGDFNRALIADSVSGPNGCDFNGAPSQALSAECFRLPAVHEPLVVHATAVQYHSTVEQHVMQVLRNEDDVELDWCCYGIHLPATADVTDDRLCHVCFAPTKQWCRACQVFLCSNQRNKTLELTVGTKQMSVEVTCSQYFHWKEGLELAMRSGDARRLKGLQDCLKHYPQSTERKGVIRQLQCKLCKKKTTRECWDCCVRLCTKPRTFLLRDSATQEHTLVTRRCDEVWHTEKTKAARDPYCKKSRMAAEQVCVAWQQREGSNVDCSAAGLHLK